MKRGLLLINLGTPNSAKICDVRRFLLKFLTDKRVVDIPAPLRHVLVYGLILPFKAPKSAKAYQSIWTKEGSPLLVNSQLLVMHLQKKVNLDLKVVLGMRYGKPSIADALNELQQCESITVLPLYPQYSSAATGSAIEESLHHLDSQEIIPSLTIINQFYQHPAYIKAQAELIKTHLKPDDFLLFSYHGIPERQLQKSDCKKICPHPCSEELSLNSKCYRAQCYQTSRLLAKKLNLTATQYKTSFQSRLGKTPWIQPYTEEELTDLSSKGVKNLCICCPSFVTDCIETLEEIGLRGKKQWISQGGEGFTLIPSLNYNQLWIEAIIEIAQKGLDFS